MLENLKKIESEKNLGGGDYFKPKNGNNVIRVLTEGVFHESEYQGKKTVKFVMFIIDRTDGKVKPYFAPYTVYKQIAQLETDPFFAFQGMPMPYDVNVKVENAGTKEVEYNVQASPNKTAITPAEIEAAQNAGTVQDYLSKLADKSNNSEPDGVQQASQEALESIASQEAPDFLK